MASFYPHIYPHARVHWPYRGAWEGFYSSPPACGKFSPSNVRAVAIDAGFIAHLTCFPPVLTCVHQATRAPRQASPGQALPAQQCPQRRLALGHRPYSAAEPDASAAPGYFRAALRLPLVWRSSLNASSSRHRHARSTIAGPSASGIECSVARRVTGHGSAPIDRGGGYAGGLFHR